MITSAHVHSPLASTQLVKHEVIAVSDTTSVVKRYGSNTEVL